jgi:hypothetical protein
MTDQPKPFESLFGESRIVPPSPTKEILEKILDLLGEEPSIDLLPAKVGALKAAIEIISADACLPALKPKGGSGR